MSHSKLVSYIHLVGYWTHFQGARGEALTIILNNAGISFSSGRTASSLQDLLPPTSALQSGETFTPPLASLLTDHLAAEVGEGIGHNGVRRVHTLPAEVISS